MRNNEHNMFWAYNKKYVNKVFKVISIDYDKYCN